MKPSKAVESFFLLTMVACVEGTIIHSSVDKEASVGERVVLECRTNLTKPGSNVEWSHKPTGAAMIDIVYKDGTIFNQYSGRMTVDGDTNNGVYDLIIQSVALDDAGLFECTDKTGDQIQIQLTVFDVNETSTNIVLLSSTEAAAAAIAATAANNNTAGIVIGVVVCIIVVALSLVLLYAFWKRRQRKLKTKETKKETSTKQRTSAAEMQPLSQAEGQEAEDSHQTKKVRSGNKREKPERPPPPKHVKEHESHSPKRPPRRKKGRIKNENEKPSDQTETAEVKTDEDGVAPNEKTKYEEHMTQMAHIEAITKGSDTAVNVYETDKKEQDKSDVDRGNASSSSDEDMGHFRYKNTDKTDEDGVAPNENTRDEEHMTQMAHMEAIWKGSDTAVKVYETDKKERDESDVDRGNASSSSDEDTGDFPDKNTDKIDEDGVAPNEKTRDEEHLTQMAHMETITKGSDIAINISETDKKEQDDSDAESGNISWSSVQLMDFDDITENKHTVDDIETKALLGDDDPAELCGEDSNKAMSSKTEKSEYRDYLVLV